MFKKYLLYNTAENLEVAGANYSIIVQEYHRIVCKYREPKITSIQKYSKDNRIKRFDKNSKTKIVRN